jgi:arginine N-succinyltransferase
MLVVRPAGPDDLAALMDLAVLSGRGFTSLPDHEPTLRERLEISRASFRAEVAPLEAWYTLMLEDTADGEVLGVASVRAAVGLKRPFFSFRVVTLAQASTVTQTRFDHRALVLVNECAGWSEVGSLFLRPERRKGGAGSLLALSRYLLIASDPARFSETVLSELRGWFDEDGSCPFWDTVGARFFRIPFDQADQMSASTDGQFILDLAPRHPIYVELLDRAARESIGRVHRDGEPARALLEKQGFRPIGLVDIFDAGPTYSARRDDIRAIRHAEHRLLRIGDNAGAGEPALVAAGGVENFRCIRADVCAPRSGRVALDAASATALRVDEGDSILVSA